MNRIGLVSKLIEGRIATRAFKGIQVERIELELRVDHNIQSQWATDRNHVRTSLFREFKRYPLSNVLAVQFFDHDDECILEDTYEVYENRKPRIAPKPTQQRSEFCTTQESFLSGPEPHNLGALVEQKVQELRQAEELERLREEQTELKSKNEVLLGQVETLESQIEAKNNLEYYSKIAGDLLPGIAKALEKTPLGPALSGLAGEKTEKDDQTTVLESSRILIKNLNDEQLSAVYMLLLELQNNPALIPAGPNRARTIYFTILIISY